ncbi:MAG: HAMP domain-containing protein [Fibrobacteria bacterium]
MKALFTRIRARILLVVLLAIVPAVALIFYSAAERKRQVSEEIENNASRLSRFLASNLERDISEGHGFLKAGAKLLQSGTSIGCAPLLAELLGDSSVFSNLGWIDADGKVLCSARSFPNVKDLPSLDLFKAIQSSQGFTMGFDFKGILSHEASIILVLPVQGKVGMLPSALIAVMDLNWLYILARSSQLPEGSAIGVSNRRGDALARYPDPDKWVGKQFPRFPKNGEEPPSEGLHIQNGIDGVKRAYAYARVHGKGDLLVHVGIKREAIYEPANRALMKQLVALGIVALLAILAAWFASDVFLLKQVRALIAATRKLASGNLSARSALPYDQGELGDLARAFDEMAETLEWRDAQLRESETERADTAGQLSDTMEIFPGPAMILNNSNSIVGANHAACGLFGYSYDAFVSLETSLLFPNHDGFTSAIERTLLKDEDQWKSMKFQCRGRKKDGSILEIELSVSKAVHGAEPHFLVILRSLQPKEANR